MRQILCLALAAAVLVVGATAIPLVSAQEDDAPQVFFEEGVESLSSKAAALLWKASEAAQKKSLFAFATTTAERVIHLDPDHKKARKYLGYEKKRRQWVVDERAAAKVVRDNQIPKGVSQAEFAKRVNTWRYETLRGAEASVADLFAGLGKACRAKGFDAAARRAYDEAVRRDPHCAAARAALGYERVGDAWLTKSQIAARDAAATPEIFEEESHLDEVLGRSLLKVRSANFVVESVFSKSRTTKLVEALETTYSLYLTDAGRDPNDSVFTAPLHGCFVQSGEDWEAWLADQVPARVAFFRNLHFYRASGDMILGVREQSEVAGSASATFEDNAVHATSHVLNDVIYALYKHPWLDEGMAYYTTLRVRGTTASWCVAEDDSRYAQPNETVEDEGLLSEFSFRARVRQLVQKGEDMPLRALATRKLQELSLSDTVKAWSVVSWMMEIDREAAIRFLSSLRASADGPAALEAHFGKGAEAIDDEWRRWVRTSH
jgi:hypothetical protein